MFLITEKSLEELLRTIEVELENVTPSVTGDGRREALEIERKQLQNRVKVTFNSNNLTY